MRTTKNKVANALFMTLLVSFMVFLFSATVHSKTFASKSIKSKLVTICHKGKTIRVDQSAVNAHLKHGDGLGSCAVTLPGDQN